MYAKSQLDLTLISKPNWVELLSLDAWILKVFLGARIDGVHFSCKVLA